MADIDQNTRSSPLALAVLSLLEVGPLHPYGLQQLIKEWGKDEVINVGNRANLYKTIRRLTEAGLITVRVTERDQQYPERTVYELTDAGREASREWLAAMLANYRNEFPDFPAALSFAMLLAPEEVANRLAARLVAVTEALARLEDTLGSLDAVLPRITLIETEYQRALLAAERDWLEAVIADLGSGAFTWSREMLMDTAEANTVESTAGPIETGDTGGSD